MGIGDLSLAVGVFDGVHPGHQVLIRHICRSTDAIAAVVTFRQNPLFVLKPEIFWGDIIGFDQKLHLLETMGVGLAVIIDFSAEFSRINGRDFINLLLDSGPVKRIALGRNFRCGHGLDTGVREIKALAGVRGVDVWVAEPVMDGASMISSSRIRQALAAGNVTEAERLLGRPIESKIL